jgi:hypothetical protein
MDDEYKSLQLWGEGRKQVGFGFGEILSGRGYFMYLIVWYGRMDGRYYPGWEWNGYSHDRHTFHIYTYIVNYQRPKKVYIYREFIDILWVWERKLNNEDGRGNLLLFQSQPGTNRIRFF